MKKLLLFLIIIVPFRLFSQANVYHPFPDTDAVWTVVDKMSHGGSHCDNISCDRSYIQKGKILFNSVQYNALYLNEHCTETWIVSSSGTPCNYDYGLVTGTLLGGLRNDSINKRVYYYNKLLSKECLLYDFDLTVGDSIANWNLWSNCSDSSVFIKVTSIDSTLVGTKYHKRYNLEKSLSSDTSIIEGVGSTTGLLGPHLFFENSNQLVCFSVLNQTVYINPISTFPCGVVAIHEEENEIEISISPNPSTGIFTINTPEKFQYSVYDVFGREVLQSTSVDQFTTLDLTSYPKGVYFVRGKVNDKLVARKIILQ